MSAASDPRDISPDETILAQIFPRTPQTHIETTIIQQNWYQCTFKAELQQSSQASLSKSSSLVVRLEPLEENSVDRPNAVALMQNVAATVIPEYVPNHWDNGTAQDLEGKQYIFSVQEFVEGCTLQEVWHDMDGESRGVIITELLQAMRKLQSVRISDSVVQILARATLREDAWKSLSEAAFGGPTWGFLKDGQDLVCAVERWFELKEPFYEKSTSVSENIAIKSIYEDLGSATLQRQDMTVWKEEAVLCHNDLNPRNIILRRTSTAGASPSYKLAAIIDWELAGFFPPSLEMALQDTYLGAASLNVSYYLALKQGSKELVPRSASQVALIQAVRLIHSSQQHYLKERRNIPAIIRKRLLERLGLKQHGDPYVGWAPAQIEFSPEETQLLEDEVVGEIIGKQ